MKHQFELVDNPAWVGKPKPAAPFPESDWHDRSHFVTIECSCGEAMHMHESFVSNLQHKRTASECKGCGDILTFEPGFFAAAFHELRRQGWII
jgi:ribosomal protein S27E